MARRRICWRRRRNRQDDHHVAGSTAGVSSARRIGTVLPWTVLAILVTAVVSAGACALLLPDKAPALLVAPKETTSAPVATQLYTGSQQVTLHVTMSDKRQLISNTTGTVTGDYSFSGLVSGKAAMKVDGRRIVALHTAQAMYRDLGLDDVGDDAQALNNELSRLGYQASGSDRVTAATISGWRRLMAAISNPGDDDGIHLSDILWIPEQNISVSHWQAQDGASIAQGAVIADIPGTIVKLTVSNGKAADTDRILRVLGHETTLPAGATSIDDAAFCATIASSEQWRAMDDDSRQGGLDATLRLAKPIKVLRVPAAAVFGMSGNEGCVMAFSSAAGDRAKTIPVRIVGSSLGVSLVTAADGSSLAAVKSVMLGSRIAETTCS